jgi:hypothetical protein
LADEILVTKLLCSLDGWKEISRINLRQRQRPTCIDAAIPVFIEKNGWKGSS